MPIPVGAPFVPLVALGARCVRAGGTLIVRAREDVWTAEFDPGTRKRKLLFTAATLDGALYGLSNIMDRQKTDNAGRKGLTP